MRRKSEHNAISGSMTPAPIGLRDVLSGAPDVVFCCDNEGRWVWVSPSMEQLVGHRPSDLIGQPAVALIAPAERTSSLRAMLRLRSAKRDANGEYECSVMSLAGQVVRVAFKINRIEHNNGETAYVGIARRGAASRTGFRALTSLETDDLAGNASAPGRIPQQKNATGRPGAAAWSGASYNDITDRTAASTGKSAGGDPAAAAAAAEAAHAEAMRARAQVVEARGSIAKAEEARTAAEAAAQARSEEHTSELQSQ